MDAPGPVRSGREQDVQILTDSDKPGYATQRSDGKFSWQQRAAWGMACVALVAALAAAYSLGRSHAARPLGVEIVIPTPSPLVVQVTGGVNYPGLVELGKGERVADAIEAAGGVTEQADLASLNLAAFLVDGMHVRIPTRDDSAKAGATDSISDWEKGSSDSLTADGASLHTPVAPSTQTLLNINTATAARLTDLPGIGPVRAEAIVAFRESRGGFVSVEELAEVAGIGPVTLDLLRPLVTVQ